MPDQMYDTAATRSCGFRGRRLLGSIAHEDLWPVSGRQRPYADQLIFVGHGRERAGPNGKLKGSARGA
jgi:hypothetical protein